jgi:hypothetical protein
MEEYRKQQVIDEERKRRYGERNIDRGSDSDSDNEQQDIVAEPLNISSDFRQRLGNLEYQRVIMYDNPRDIEQPKEPEPPRQTFKRANTFRALGRIFGKWKRGNSIKPITDGNICTICLSEYEKGQAVVQLK